MEHFANKFWRHPNAFVTYVLILQLFFLISEWITCCPQVFVALLKGLKIAQTVTKLQLSNASKKRTSLRKGGKKRNVYTDSLASGFTIIQLRCNNQSDCTTKEAKLTQSLSGEVSHCCPEPETERCSRCCCRMTQRAGNTPSPGSEMWKSRAEILLLAAAADCCPKKGKECKWQQLLLQPVTLPLDTFKLHLLDDKSFNHNQRLRLCS